ncbi:DUF6193 family natural product biosynthesis protein [Streptomyces sp. NPDC048507]|uniref:DUF6193 family natural product biosynthesis protein n=1 Tax=Streptomyces sp. NPDC048507 TaxID=3365560 RepID=UPI003718F0FB
MTEDPDAAHPHGGSLRVYALHYPDVVRAGSLCAALRERARWSGTALEVGVPPLPGTRRAAARVIAGDRTAYVTMDVRRRDFRLHFRAGDPDGGPAVVGGTGDLGAVVAALDSWARGARGERLVAGFAFLAVRKAAGGRAAVEGPEAVAARWAELRESAAVFPRPGRHELVEAAFREPELRALCPGLSMDWLRFGRREGPPAGPGLPMVMPLGDGLRYRVRMPDGALREVTGAAGAVALVVRALPGGDGAPPGP